MKKKFYFELLLAFCLFAFLIGYAQNKESLVNINKIYVQPTELKARIVLETDSQLSLIKTYYSQESPKTIIIEWSKVKTVKKPHFVPDKSSLIQNLRVEKYAENQLRLFVYLKEKVPYRIFSDQGRSVVELNKIYRSRGKYLIDPETKMNLEEKAGTEILLNKIDFSEKKDRIDIIARMSGQAVSNIFALENPARLVIDLFETVNTLRLSTFPVNKLGVERIRTSQFQSAYPMISRIVFDLSSPKFYKLNSENNKLVVSFFKEDVYQATPQIKPLPAKEVKSELDFKLPPLKEKEIKEAAKEESKVVKTPTPEKQTQKKAAPDLNENSSQIKVEKIKETPIKEEPKVTETATPEKQIQEKVQILQEDDQFKPRTITEPEKRYTGDIISLKFKDADLRDVILYLGHFAGLNVVFDPEVSGRVTCDMVDVPWDQALDIILKINKMGKTLEGNVLRIATLNVLSREQEQERRLRESRELAGPIQVKTITLSYSKARDVQSLLVTKLSPRGEIIIDNRTNTLIISDTKEKLALLEKLIPVLDTPTPQVSIEARIVEATSNFVRNLGIQWGFRGIADPFYGNQTSLRFPNKILVDGSIIQQGIITKGIGGPLGGYAINLPAPAFSTALGISMGNVLDTFRLDMALTALETTGEGRIISCPKVTTQNNMEAEIIQGRQIPVQTVANFTVSTRYVNAALELRATPQITAEGTIIMTIDIQNNAADFANLVNGIPPITRQSARTTVMIKDGGTTVIGGIYRTEDSVTREGVPFLQKIPILGVLFRSLARTRQNRELLIFITPRILK